MARADVETHVNEALERVRKHPFILDAHRGHLSKAQATRWIYCAGRESRTFPKILEHLLAWSTNNTIRDILQENLDDELGNGNPEQAHFKHYTHLLSNLHLPLEGFDNYRERAGITLALHLAFNVATSNAEEISIGYMLVNEAMTPVTYEAARSALSSYYPSLQTNFFDLHIEVDEHHVAALYDAVDALESPNDEMLHFGISLGERGMEVLLDEAYGVFDSYDEPILITAGV
jgi:pyrroloquinoline quinone (PQQ) biosynthesis protein C